MTAATQLADPVAARKTAPVDRCDLCGHDGQRELAKPSEARCRIVMCTHCGLFYASPALAPDTLDQFYDEEFQGDAGTNRRLQNGEIEGRKVDIEDRIAKSWAMPLIASHVDVAGKRVLDIRCRTGALAETLSRAGAEVTAIDPLQPNADFARKRGTIGDVRFVPIEDFEQLAMFEDEEFDVITALSIHLLSHSPAPRRLMQRLNSLLKPGGHLFLDEKDVFYPVRATGETVFDSGPPHYFHFTADTMRKMYEAAGFEVVECAIDPVRKKSTRHIRSVGRKPINGINGSAACETEACDTEKVIAALDRAERQLRRRHGFNTFMKSARRAVRKLWT